MSLNDPQWGKRGKNGPPDLDEIWRNVNKKLNDMFSRRGSNNEPPERGQGPRFALPMGGVGLILLLVVAIWLLSGFYIVDEGRRGVELRFGRYKVTTLPGLRWHWPYPIILR